MKSVLIALLALCAAAPTAAQERVILDLNEGYGEGRVGQYYTPTRNAESTFDLGSSRNGHRGRAAEAVWRIESGPGRLGYVGFGYLHPIAAESLSPSYAFPDLTPYTHLSLWYNNTVRAEGADRVAFQFELYEREVETGPDGDRRTQVWVYQSDDVLATPTGWTQLLIPLRATDAVGDGGFAVRPGGFRGNGTLDLDDIKYWSLLLLVEGEPVGSVIAGTTRFDYLTAVSLGVDAAPDPAAPLASALRPAEPNPFAAATTLVYTLAEPGVASLRVYDVLGREVAVPVAPREHAAGRHEVRLDGRQLAAGTYLCVLETPAGRHTRLLTRSR